MIDPGTKKKLCLQLHVTDSHSYLSSIVPAKGRRNSRQTWDNSQEQSIFVEEISWRHFKMITKGHM